MPNIKPLSEFNRNQTAVIDELHASREPLYLTRNGSASLVVMDAEAFDAEMSFRRGMYANEMRVYDGLMRGYVDYQRGDVVDAADAEAAVVAQKGWA